MAIYKKCTVENLYLNIMDKKQKRQLLQAITHILALVPLILAIWYNSTDQLGVDPTNAIILRTGKAAIILLMLSLACTPVNILFGWRWAMTIRKTLGLYTMLYVTLHLLAFLWLDYLFDWEFIWEAVLDQRFVLVGFTAFLLLIPLTITSNKTSIRKLGKKWRTLHRLVYLIGMLAVVHFTWLVKNVYTEPIIFGIILIFLLLVRTPTIKKYVRAWRG